MIIKLRKYNEIRELLIENRTTGFQGHVCYWDGDQRVSVTRVAVWRRRGQGFKQGTRMNTIGLHVRNEHRDM